MELLIDEWKNHTITRAFIEYLTIKREEILIELEDMSRADKDEVADGLVETVVLRRLVGDITSGSFINRTNNENN